MENIIKVFSGCSKNLFHNLTIRQLPLKRYCVTYPQVDNKPKKRSGKLHPYKKIHPWNSLDKFAKSLVKGVIFNEDGLVAINKPYGISGKDNEFKSTTSGKFPAGIVNGVNYSVTDALPLIASELGYPSLSLVKSPERFTTGIAILAANQTVEIAVEKSLIRAQALKIVPTTYWAVTTKLPNEKNGEKRLAMKMKVGPDGRSKQPIIIESWSKNQREKSIIKILNVQFKVLSNSMGNLSSLVEIKSSTKKWHALRLFTATALYSPILGDNLYGSRVQKVMGKWMNISPFVDAAKLPPKLNRDLLEVLKVSPGKEQIIPVHLHVREIYLPMFMNRGNDLVLEAPPMPEFTWTCQQLKFKHKLFEVNEETEEEMADNSTCDRFKAVA